MSRKFLAYCDDCGKDCNAEEKIERQTFKIHGKSIDVDVTMLVCIECGNEISDEKYMNDQLRAINEAYIKATSGLTSEQIKNVRLQYRDLGIRPFAKILGIGSASIARHETGELPSDKHISIYKELNENPRSIFEYFNKNKESLSPRELKKVEHVLRNWSDEQEGRISTQFVEVILDDEEIIESIHKPFAFTEFTGYKDFNLDKFSNMILFFSKWGVNKTKLMKLLWYSDFLYFKMRTASISGAAYARIKFGPVPKDHEIALAHLQHMGVIEIEESLLNDEGWVKMTVRAKQDLNPNVFEKEEMVTLERVNYIFEDYGSRKISEYSHKERAWIETPDDHLINYKYSRDFNFE
ncbi:hypothetical protein PAEAM_45220 [Paenibacillus sp. GM1FR]|uniref:type II TA system antitoxin MqsA family protein n=1 Tax=Paenibacillus sp. GM1FR TaxID=2059267 RepID=UPI000C274BD9|nr:type II TA system antitoxin MqsA family protein [Paenibacillus sp. GM1FR]PJN52537.1 hypothetical protein PAEAM_45220 [Paenibacillus sp. GM1FR]